jgi:hypothetical protein
MTKKWLRNQEGNDENVSVIGREQRGYSRSASKSPGENYPERLCPTGRPYRSGPPRPQEQKNN